MASTSRLRPEEGPARPDIQLSERTLLRRKLKKQLYLARQNAKKLGFDWDELKEQQRAETREKNEKEHLVKEAERKKKAAAGGNLDMKDMLESMGALGLGSMGGLMGGMGSMGLSGIPGGSRTMPGAFPPSSQSSSNKEQARPHPSGLPPDMVEKFRNMGAMAAGGDMKAAMDMFKGMG